MARWMRAVAVAVAALGAGAGPAHAGLPPIKHVFVVVLENKNYAESFGPDSPAPYLSRTLPSLGAQLANYYGTAHESLPNYLAMISGQGPNGVTQADCLFFLNVVPGLPAADGQVVGQGCVYPAAVKTVADQLQAKGLSWKGYMEDMANGPAGQAKSCRHPAIGARDPTQSARRGDEYAARHNPFVYFHSIIDSPVCARNDVDFRALASDLRSPRTTPSLAFITPNLCNDGHDEHCVDGAQGGLPRADRWLRREIPAILASPGFKDDGLLIVTFDEAEDLGAAADSSACCGERPGPNTIDPGGPTPGPGGGRVGAVLVSPFIRPGTFLATSYNHYSLLRSVEDLFGLGHLGFAGQAGLRAFSFETFNRTPKLGLRVRPRSLRRGRTAVLSIRVGRQARVRLSGRCGRRSRLTGFSGTLRIKVRPRRRGICRVTASRSAWAPARVRVRVR